MSEENKQAARQVLEELFEKGNLEAANELIHPDFVNHEAPPKNPQGPEGLKETVRWLRDLWGPMRFEIEDEISEGDKVGRAGRHAWPARRRVPWQEAHRHGVRDQADPRLATGGRQVDRALGRAGRSRPGLAARAARLIRRATSFRAREPGGRRLPRPPLCMESGCLRPPPSAPSGGCELVDVV